MKPLPILYMVTYNVLGVNVFTVIETYSATEAIELAKEKYPIFSSAMTQAIPLELDILYVGYKPAERSGNL